MFRSPKLTVELSFRTVALADLGRLASKLGSTRRRPVFLGGRRVEDQDFTTRWPSLPTVFIHIKNVFIEMTQHKQNI